MVARRAAPVPLIPARSSNGRTMDSGSMYLGSNPSLAGMCGRRGNLGSAPKAHPPLAENPSPTAMLSPS